MPAAPQKAPSENAPDGVPEPVVRVFRDLEILSHAAAEHLILRAEEAVAARARFTLALSGGSTPRPLFELLGTTYRDELPWHAVHLFWGDERCVPPDDAASNFRLARETFIDRVPLPPEHVHRMAGEQPPPEAAAAYEELLRETFDEADGITFDCALMGLGADAHTASLFPEDDPRAEPGGPWVRAVTAPERHTPRRRITLTLTALNRSREALFLVAGAEKRDALRRTLSEKTTPAARLRPREHLLWFADADAHPETP